MNIASHTCRVNSNLRKLKKKFAEASPCIFTVLPAPNHAHRRRILSHLRTRTAYPRAFTPDLSTFTAFPCAITSPYTAAL
jgi:hypothetical protein